MRTNILRWIGVMALALAGSLAAQSAPPAVAGGAVQPSASALAWTAVPAGVQINGPVQSAAAMHAVAAPLAATTAAAADVGTRVGGADAARVRIGPGDLLELNVFDVPELAQPIRVDDKGMGVVNLIGALHFAGMTTAEAQGQVESKLKSGNFVLDPHVSILIREYGTQGVSVVGEVRKPGVYPVLGKRNLLDIIADAGGTTPFAGHEATIKRRDAQDKPITASLSNDPGELLGSNVELEPGDTLIVPKAGIVYVIGDVGRPGGFVMQTSGRITLLQAVALAAGVNRTAAATKSRIIRKTATGFEEANVNVKRLLQGKAADIELHAEDIVYIPPSNTKAFLLHAPALAQSAVSSAIYQSVP